MGPKLANVHLGQQMEKKLAKLKVGQYVQGWAFCLVLAQMVCLMAL
jgi:hypothetical protein